MSRNVAKLSAKQHQQRNSGLGSSDAAVAAGLSPFKTLLELWLEKTKRVIPPDISDKPVIHFGNVMEDVVAQEFAARNDTKVRQRHQAFVKTFSDTTLKMVAHVDRLTPPRKILECKNIGFYGAADWKDSPPAHYRLQVEHQLICADRNEAYIAAIIGGNSYVQHEVIRNPEMSEFLIAREKEFWACVENDTPPEPQSASDVIALHPHDAGTTKIATPELAEIHAELGAVKAVLKFNKEREQILAEKIKMFLGKDTHLVSQDGTKLATFKTDSGQVVTDWKSAFGDLAKMHNITDQFLSNYQNTRQTRRFNVRQIKND